MQLCFFHFSRNVFSDPEFGLLGKYPFLFVTFLWPFILGPFFLLPKCTYGTNNKQWISRVELGITIFCPSIPGKIYHRQVNKKCR
jgi:hypothetical protein